MSKRATASAALEAARSFDAAGDHQAAYESLSRASRQGDLAAMSELAHRLLVGDRAPLSPQHAMPLLIEAMKGGEPRALARAAALTAGGAFVQQGWEGALQLLGQAAAAGDAAAQGQLRCLQPIGAPKADWATMAKRVSLAKWLRPAKLEALHEKVQRVPKLAPLPVCAWLIGRAEGRLQPALVYDSVDRKVEVHRMRTNTMAMYNYATLDVVQFLVQARMALSCGYRIQHFEHPTILHYNVGEQITPHFDFIDANAQDYAQQIEQMGQRMITFLLYLNDAYEGGETTFPELGIVHRGRLGDGLFFINAHPDLAPDRRMLHTGSPPTSGEKWVISQFISSKALRP
jgi:prolyl 4-hydroxylase